MRIASLLATAALVLLSACTDTNHAPVAAITTATTPEQAAPTVAPAPRVTLIMKTLTNPFFIEMEQGARRAQLDSRVDLQVKTATQEASVDQQIRLVEQEIQAKTQAIVIAPGDSTRLVPVLKKAQDAGIHIVNIDNQLSPEVMVGVGMKPVPFISVDNEQGAYRVAQYLAAQVKRPTEAAIIEGIRSANNAQARKRGAERAFHENPQLRLVATETANWKIDEAYELAKRLFKDHPRLGVVFCANDMMAIGVLKHLQETGNTRVLVVGFDALSEAKTAIRAGQLLATVDQQAAQQGYLGVMTAWQLLQGRPQSLALEVDAQLVTAQTLK